MKLFEYAVYKDEKVDKQTGNVIDPAVVLVQPTTLLAKDEQTVGMIAARSIDDEHMSDVDRIQVVIRPF